MGLRWWWVVQVGRQSVGNFLGSCLPDLNGVLIALFIRDKTTVEVLHDLFNLLVSRSRIAGFSSGMIASGTATVMAERWNTYSLCLMWSSMIAQRLVPCFVRQRLMMSGSFFLVTWKSTS